MEHIAIMKKSWKLLPKILTQEKKIESRWYKVKLPPWDKITKGDNVFFKNSGEPISVKTEVEKVVQISDLTSQKVKQILKSYGKQDGINKKEITKFYKIFKNKKYCILIFLKNPQKIEPFNINKSGFGNMSSWISAENPDKIRVTI